MATEFTAPSSPPTSWPQYPVEEVASTLAEFFIKRDEAEWRDARELFSPQVQYARVPEFIMDAGLTATSVFSKAFYEAMNHLHSVLQAAQEWTQVVGAVAEAAIRILLERKYGTLGRPHLRGELCAHLYSCALPLPPGQAPLASTGDKPMDAICWDDGRDVGEMHEVKRLIVNFKDAKKLRLLRQFKTAAEQHTGRPVWMGLSGFYDPVSEVEEAVRTLLMLFNEADPLGLDILVPDTYAAWERTHYL